jgi:hypothetical protein
METRRGVGTMHAFLFTFFAAHHRWGWPPYVSVRPTAKGGLSALIGVDEVEELAAMLEYRTFKRHIDRTPHMKTVCILPGTA